MKKIAPTAAKSSALVPSVMTLTLEDMKARLDWIQSEIDQLSSRQGVSERLQALRYTQSQLIAARELALIMAKPTPL